MGKWHEIVDPYNYADMFFAKFCKLFLSVPMGPPRKESVILWHCPFKAYERDGNLKNMDQISYSGFLNGNEFKVTFRR